MKPSYRVIVFILANDFFKSRRISDRFHLSARPRPGAMRRSIAFRPPHQVRQPFSVIIPELPMEVNRSSVRTSARQFSRTNMQ